VTSATSTISVSDLAAKAVADMQVDLSWRHTGGNVSHCSIYRDTSPECAPTQLNFIGQSASGSFTDRPQVHPGGWLRSCLAPSTTYHYRVVPVDRANNPGPPSAFVAVTTPSSDQANLPPVAVEGVRAILVTPLNKRLNFVTLLFRTACEPDVTHYEIHRSTQSGFAAGSNALAGMVKSDDLPPRSGGYGETPIKYQVKEYDHATCQDINVEANTTFYYRVRAVDAAGQKGPLSAEVSVRTKEPFLTDYKVTAQSVYAPEFEADLALDGDPDPHHAWISKPYGGGTKAQPRDVWWAVEFPNRQITIRGVKIIGDHREVIPLQKNLRVQVRDAGTWRTMGEIQNAPTKDLTVTFDRPVTTDALRVFVPAADLPQSARADTDGIVRICELFFILPDGTEKGIELSASTTKLTSP
jgi:hypothetical protein